MRFRTYVGSGAAMRRIHVAFWQQTLHSPLSGNRFPTVGAIINLSPVAPSAIVSLGPESPYIPPPMALAL